MLTGAAVFDALRTEDLTYVEYGNGERELYELRRDPFQLESRARSADPTLLAALSTRLAELRNCVAAQCRAIETRMNSTPRKCLGFRTPQEAFAAAAAG